MLMGDRSVEGVGQTAVCATAIEGHKKLANQHPNTTNHQRFISSKSLFLQPFYAKIIPMGKIEINTKAPDFTLETYQGESVTLSQLNEEHNILLVFNRGFF